MRRRLLALVAVGIWLAVGAAPALAHGQHGHILCTPSGSDPAVAPATLTHMQHDAFHNFHNNVHTGTPGGFAFAQPNNPVGFRPFGGGC